MMKEEELDGLTTTIPLCLPKLPTAEQIFPYLKNIDENRWYSNYGPLTRDFLFRIAELFNIDTSEVICASNGTVLLQLALQALKVKAGSLCIVPSWTFIATPLAVVASNLKPFFVDVDIHTQSIDPNRLEKALPHLFEKGEVGAVIAVAPFGMPINIKAWNDFTFRTNIPVIIDAAASFDSVLHSPEMQVTTTPMMVSLHATKVLGIGEGGVLFCKNKALIKEVESLTQFGFPRGIRNAQAYGMNAKLSEYAAAVGLAALDNWQQTQAHWRAISDYYRTRLNETNIGHLLSSKWVTSTCNIIVSKQADSISAKLNSLGMMARKWWGDGCHYHKVFQNALREDLRNSEYLRQSILGLPYFIGMKYEDIDFIVHHLSLMLEKAEIA